VILLAPLPAFAGDDAKQAARLPARAVARLGSLAFRHGNVISAAALAPDGTMAATASFRTVVRDEDGQPKAESDRSIRLWHVNSGKPASVLLAPDGPVLALDFSLDGRRLAAVANKEVLCWDVAAGEEIGRSTLDDFATLVRFLPDGKRVLTVDLNMQIREWDVDKGKDRVFWDGKDIHGKFYPHTFDLAADGSCLALLLGKVPEPADPPAQPNLAPPHLVQVRELPGGKVLFKKEEARLPRGLALSPDKQQVVFGNERLGFWDIAKNQKRRELESVAPLPVHPALGDIAGLKNWSTADSVAFSPNGKIVAATHGPGDVRLWHAESGKKIGELIHTLSETPFGGNKPLTFSADSKLLAIAGSGVLRLMDTSTGKEIVPGPGHRLPLADFRFTPDGRRLFSRTAAETCFWEVRTGELAEQHSFAPFLNRAILTHSLERKLVITWVKEQAVLEDLATAKVLSRFPKQKPAPAAAMFSFDGAIACFLTRRGEEKFHARFFAIPECKELFEREYENVTDFNFSPVNGTFHWQDSDGAYVEADARTGKELRKLQVRPEEDSTETAAARIYSWDGRYIAFRFLDPDVPVMAIWDVPAERVAVRVPMQDFISALDITYDNRLMVCLRAGQSGIRVVELASGKERRPLLLPRGEIVTRLATSPIDYTVASGMPGNAVLLWDLARPTRKLAEGPLTVGTLAALWRDLADADALKAETAIEAMVKWPYQAVSLLRDCIKPVTGPDAKQLQRLIAALDDETTSKGAYAELGKFGDLAEPALRTALKQKPPAEARRRIKQLLAKLPQPPDGPTLQSLRALEVLEKVGGPDVMPILASVAEGAPAARLTQEAMDARKRLLRKR
jgi:WD40 repeat protein